MRFALASWALLLAGVAHAERPELVVQTGHGGPSIVSLAISPDGELLASGDADGLVIVWDLRSSKKLRALTGHSKQVAVAFSPDGKELATTSNDETTRIWDLRTGLTTRTLPGTSTNLYDGVAYSPDGTRVAAATPEGPQLYRRSDGAKVARIAGEGVVFRPGTRQLASRVGREVVLFDGDSGRALRRFGGHTGYVASIGFSADGKRLLTFADHHARVFGADDGKLIADLEDKQASVALLDPAGTTVYLSGYSGLRIVEVASRRERKIDGALGDVLALAPRGGLLAVAGSHDIDVLDTATGRRVAPLTGTVDQTYGVRFVDERRVLEAQGGELKLWDLDALKPLRRFPGARHALSHDHHRLATSNGANDPVVEVHSLDDGARERAITTDLAFVKTLTFFDHDRALLVAGLRKDGGAVHAFSLTDGKQVFSLPVKGFFLGAALSRDERRLAVLSSVNGKDTVELWDTRTHARVGTVAAGTSFLLAPFSERTLAFWPDDQHLVAGTEREPGTFGAVALSLRGGAPKLLDVGDTFWVQGDALLSTTDGGRRVQILDGKSLVPPRTLEAEAPLAGLDLDETHGLAAAADADGGFWLWRIEDNKLRRLLRFVGSSFQRSAFGDGTILNQSDARRAGGYLDYVVARPDGEYLASRDATALVGFRVGTRAYRFEQFDLWLDRPDHVLDTLGRAPAELIAGYAAAHERRLAKMGVGEAQLAPAAAPSLALTGAAPPHATRTRALTLSVRASDTDGVTRLYAFDNGVPVPAGAIARGRRVDATLRIELSAGVNHLSVSAVNAHGVESLPIELDVTLDAPARRDVYLLAVGVGHYADARYDLTYAAKDARNLIELFAARDDAAAHVHTLALVDGDATREKILAAHKFLASAGVDDEVILFIAGHGLLDEHDRYFFATHDLDFDHPAARGLPYEAIEGLLEPVAARQKLLLMDTCHSGELDTAAPALPPATNVVSRPSGARGVTAGRPQHPSDLLGQLFTDLRRGVGATVISAAGGAQFAYEDASVSNGVFTHAVLEGLGAHRADANGDGTVTVAELRAYVIERVDQLTGHRQRPTSRRENVENDFAVW